jgi:hypothetical protein
MGEKWVLIFLGNDEILRCNSCDEYQHNQKVHLYLNVDDEIDTVVCDSCWKLERGQT